MLLKFNFCNYKSFRDEVSLDLTATKISEFADLRFRSGNINILPIAGIFGANASGKSNVIDAFRFMVHYVIMSLNFAGGQINPALQGGIIRPIPFLFDLKSREGGTKFEVYFTLNNDASEKIYQYGFIYNNNAIEEEWLNYKAKTSRDDFRVIFYRGRQDENDFSGLDAGISKNIKVSMQKETLILTLGAKLNEPILSGIYQWFSQILCLNLGSTTENIILAQSTVTRRMLDKKVQDAITKYLAAFDSNIIKISAQEREINTITKQKTIEVNFYHKLNDSDDTIPLPLTLESSGTQKMFHLYPFFNSVLMNGGVLFVDELNARLHPLLLRTIMQMFLDEKINVNKAQLVFTSHDVWQLKSNIMRRDEIWFTEKDEKGVSNLYSLSDFVDEDGEKIRKDEDYQKNYLVGKYGAIPNLSGFEGVFN